MCSTGLRGILDSSPTQPIGMTLNFLSCREWDNWSLYMIHVRYVNVLSVLSMQPVQIPFPANSVEWYKALALSCGPYSNDQWSTDISLGISLLEREDLRQDARVEAHVAAVATHFRWHPCPKKHLRWDKDRSRAP